MIVGREGDSAIYGDGTAVKTTSLHPNPFSGGIIIGISSSV